jgi:hypothetical protein
VLGDSVDQRARHLGARLVTLGVHDALARVRRFLAKREATGGIGVELRAGVGEFAHARRTFGNEHFDSGGVAKCSAGRQGVLSVQFSGVAGAECCRNAALRVRGGRIAERTLGEHHDLAVISGAPRGVQSCDARSNDDKPRANPFGHPRRY